MVVFGCRKSENQKGKKMKKIIVSIVLSSLVFNIVAFAGIGGKKAAYQGGTVTEEFFAGSKKPVEGNFNTDNKTELKFEYKLNKLDKVYSIPYDKIIDIEYGQKAGRRVGAAIATAILLAPVGLFLLFSKKRKHYVTIGYKDADDKEQAAVFEIGKDIIRISLANLEARSGKTITYQDDEAKKSSKS
jgi:hypothetical protein